MSETNNVGRSFMKFTLIAIGLILIIGIGKAKEQRKKQLSNKE